MDRGAGDVARSGARRGRDRTPPCGFARPRHGRADRGGVDARSGAARSVNPSRKDPRPVPAPSGAIARAAVRRRGALADDRPALHPPDAARGPRPAHACRLHGRRVVHVHTAKAVAPRARPYPRPSEPDRAVAALAPGRCGADADRWLGRVDGDAARRPLAVDARGPRCSEVLYAASFDEALPEDPAARYAEADARLGERLTAARARADDPSVVFPDPYGTFFTPGGVVAEVVALAGELVTQTT